MRSTYADYLQKVKKVSNQILIKIFFLHDVENASKILVFLHMHVKKLHSSNSST